MVEFSLKINRFFLLQKRKIIFSAKVLIAFLLISYLYNSIQFEGVIKALDNVNYYVLFTAVILLLPNLFLQYFKWKIICNQSLSEYNNRNIFDSLFSGFSAAIITPARLGEFAGRMLGLNDKDPLKVASATVFDKLFTFIQIIFIGIISSVIYLYYFMHFSIILMLLTLLSALLSIVVFFYYGNNLKNKFNFIRKVKLPSRIKNSIGIFFLYKRSMLIKLFSLSFSFYLCYLLQFALLLFAFSNRPLFFQYLWIGSLVMLIKALLPISIGELGVREGASVFFMPQIGIEASAAFNASIFLFLINILVPSLVGLFILFRKK